MTEVASPVETRPIEPAVRDRRSTRSFSDQPVDREVVRELLETSMWAPSPHNAQPWRFTVLFDGVDKQRLADAMADRLAADLREDGQPHDAIEHQTSRSRQRIAGAPVVILCSLVRDGLVSFPDERRNLLEWQMAVQSVGAVLQTLFLLAGERGLGTCWMAAPMYCPELVRDILDLDRTVHPQALVLLGYPAGPGKVRPRRPVGEIVDLR